MEFAADGKELKSEEEMPFSGGGTSLDPQQNKRLIEIRSTFHPSYIPSLFIAEEKGPTEVTFHLKNEDHTICNPLREVLNRHPAVLHVGYTIPHPSERLVAFVLRVKDGFTCQEVMRDGFKVLMDIFGNLGEKFSEAVTKYKLDNGMQLDDEDMAPLELDSQRR
ncbi:hypothetical protein BV898_05634 [Hypsibius exemplaris]|uniref:DNA-directed RNA polymerase I subunit D n=1 Tax=Hypsibius exemplaris TaxID=2072580 RepID=A0A1W0WYS4_HYPEX|nr:hypothetical protein BV898_05634 [Hypsibius exemplaris]